MKTIESWFGVMCLAIFAGWFLGFRMMGAEEWLPAWYNAGSWGDIVVVAMAAASLYLMPTARTQIFLTHCMTLVLIWYLPGAAVIFMGITDEAVPDDARQMLQNGLSIAMLSMTAAFLIAAFARRRVAARAA